MIVVYGLKERLNPVKFNIDDQIEQSYYLEGYTQFKTGDL